MPDTPSLITVKRFTYRGANEEYSNKYHFSGTTPADAAAWKTLADAVIAQEKTVVNLNHVFVRAYGYNAGADTATAVIDYVALGGTLVVGTWSSTGVQQAGDAAMTLRWMTPNLAQGTGKRIYLRKYFHGAFGDSANPDQLVASQKTALQALGAKLIDGTLPGSFRVCGPQGAVASTPLAGAFITTRTLKRRGKRNPTTP